MTLLLFALTFLSQTKGVVQVPRNFQLPAIHLRRKGRCEKRIAPFIVAMLALQENMSALAYNSSAHCTDRNNNNELEILNKKINFLQIASKCNYLSFSFFFFFSFSFAASPPTTSSFIFIFDVKQEHKLKGTKPLILLRC